MTPLNGACWLLFVFKLPDEFWFIWSSTVIFLIIDKVKESSDERCYVQDKFKCNVCHERTNRGFVPCKIHFKILNDLGMSKL